MTRITFAWNLWFTYKGLEEHTPKDGDAFRLATDVAMPFIQESLAQYNLTAVFMLEWGMYSYYRVQGIQVVRTPEMLNLLERVAACLDCNYTAASIEYELGAELRTLIASTNRKE